MLDSERIAREVLAHPLLPKAFKRAGQEQGPDEQHQLLALWHNRRRSILTTRQHLVTRRSTCCASCRWGSQSSCPTPRRSSHGSRAPARRNRRRRYDAPTKLRLQLLDGYRTQIKALDLEEKQVVAQLEELVDRSGSTLGELSGLSIRSVAELLVEVGDPRRFTEGGFARFNGSAPLPASTAEGPGEPIRHRYNPGGNRRVNAVLHRMAVTQLCREPRAQRIYANARAGGHTKKEARPRAQAPPLQRHLPAHDPRPARAAPRSIPPGRLTVRGRRAVKDGPSGPSAASRAAASLTAIGARAPLIRQGGT